MRATDEADDKGLSTRERRVRQPHRRALQQYLIARLVTSGADLTQIGLDFSECGMNTVTVQNER
jgi:hypothetical protein